MNKLDIPKEFTIVSTDNQVYKVLRPDGLTIFIDRKDDEVSKALNHIRINATQEIVIATVGMVRGMQIAQNYINNYGTEDTPNLIENITKRYLNKYLNSAS